jgi:hypothetical protein
VIMRYLKTFAPLKTIGAGLTYTMNENATHRVYSFTAGTGSISW